VRAARRMAFVIACSFIAVGCSGLSGELATARPLLLAESPSAETPEPSSKPTAAPKPLSVKVTKWTRSVRRGGTASVTVRTTKGASCDISVEYASGFATAKGLSSKKASSSGVVTWKWKVGSNTTRGTWPIDVACSLGNRSGDASVRFRVT
jgi:hypothetical protein